MVIDIKDFCEANGFDPDDISDGYHTFGSLYHQRLVLFATLVNVFCNRSWKTKKHEDGELCFGGGWFLVGIETPKGPYTYHYPEQYWDMFHCEELPKAPKWDGHTDEDVERLLSLATTLIKYVPENLTFNDDISAL